MLPKYISLQTTPHPTHQQFVKNLVLPLFLEGGFKISSFRWGHLSKLFELYKSVFLNHIWIICPPRSTPQCQRKRTSPDLFAMRQLRQQDLNPQKWYDSTTKTHLTSNNTPTKNRNLMANKNLKSILVISQSLPPGHFLSHMVHVYIYLRTCFLIFLVNW